MLKGKYFLFVSLFILIISLMLSACVVEENKGTEQRITSLNKSFMCPVCPGESIDQSQNDLAGQMRNVVIQKVYEGKTDKEIKEYFISKYGPVVLMEPPRKGIGLVAWVFPPILFGITVFIVFFALFFLKRNSKQSKQKYNQDLTEEELKVLHILQKKDLTEEDISVIIKSSSDK